MSQTSIQNKQTIRYGSAKVLIGDRFDKLRYRSGKKRSIKRNGNYSRC